MENAITLASIMGPVYLLLGLSLLLHVGAWQKLMDTWKKDHFGLFAIMFMYAILGLISVRMYNVWEWNVWLLVTITGWGLLLKSVLYFLLPGSVLKSMMGLYKKSAGLLYFAGVLVLAAGAALTYYTYYV